MPHLPHVHFLPWYKTTRDEDRTRAAPGFEVQALNPQTSQMAERLLCMQAQGSFLCAQKNILNPNFDLGSCRLGFLEDGLGDYAIYDALNLSCVEANVP